MKIKNKDLIHVINFIDGLGIKGLKSIHRTNISNKLKEKVDSLQKAQQQLQEEYKTDKKGQQEELRKLIESHVTVDDTDSKVEMYSIKSAVKPLVAEDSEHEFKDGDAMGVAALYVALDLGGENNEGND